MPAALAPPPPAPPPEPPPPTAAPPRLLMTRAEFEAADESPGTRVEWLGVSDETRDGEPLGFVWPRFGFDSNGNFQMATPGHREIVANLMLGLGARVDRDVWEIVTQDGEVGCPTGRHRFPDVVLIRRPAVHAPNPGRVEQVILNASVCIEVLSDSTEEVDLTDKPADYLSVPSVTDYVTVEQRARRVLHRRRVPDAVPARWVVTRLEGPEDVLTFSDPALTLPLADIYARVPVE